MTEELSEQIIKRICQCGWKAYLCGGAIRDIFLDKDPDDYDIVTNALPEELEKIFPDRKVNTHGISFLVTTIDGIEVSTYRYDTNFGPGRFNCITNISESLEDDLKRRDFTINAFAVCPYTGEVVDKFGGLQDLNDKLIRFVGDAGQRIYEDPLRMIRAARFACLIEGQIVPDSFKAIVNNKEKINMVSPERIRIELMKVMKYSKPSIFFDILQKTGLLKILIPELDNTYGFPGGQYHGETIDIHSNLTGDRLSSRNPILRLTGYLHDIGKVPCYNEGHFHDHEKVGADMALDILQRYKFTNKEQNTVEKLIRFHMLSLNNLRHEKAVRKLLRRLTENGISFKDWFLLRIADKKSNLNPERKFYSKEEIKNLALTVYKSLYLKEAGFKTSDLKVNGRDIMQVLEISPGKKVGEILEYLLNKVIDNPELNTRETLLTILGDELQNFID